MTEWIDVNEKLPKENTRVLVAGMSEYDEKIYTDIDTDRILNGKWVRWNKLITHWMPLPEPPCKQSENIIIPLEQTDIGVRAYHCLKHAGINTVNELANYSESDLHRVRNLGLNCLNEVLELCKQYGIRLKDEQ